MSVQVIRFAPGLKPVLKHQEHDQASHGNWAEGSQGTTSDLSDDEIRDVIYNSKTVNEMFQKVAKRLGKSMKPSVENLSEDEITHYRGVQDVSRDAQRLLDGKVKFTEFQTWGQGIYLAEDKEIASHYGTLIGMKLDSSAKIVQGETTWDSAFDVSYDNPRARTRNTTTSSFIDLGKIETQIRAGKMDNLSISDMRNVYWAAKGYDGFTTYGETVLFNGSKLTINKADIGTAVRKHQEHDQKTHGNWATFTSDELIAEWEKTQGRVPASPANPEGTNTQALRSWVDGPFRNFSGNYPINDVIRHIQHGILGLPLTPYYEVFSDRQRYIDERTLNSQTKNLIESLDNAPQSQPTLWRGQAEGMQREGILAHGGMGYDSLLNMKEGDEFVATMFSTSRDKDIASMYAQVGIEKNTRAPVVIFRIEAGAKGLRTSTVPMDKEVLTGGKFKVTGTAETTIKTAIDWTGPAGSRTPIMKEHPVHIISLTQLDTFGKEDYVKEDFQPDSQFRVGRNR